MIKTLIAQAARHAGWQASVEWSPEVRTWTADVLAELDGRRMALEVQWSRHDAGEFARRQKRYAADGVECFWDVHRRNKDEARRSGVPHIVFEGDDAPQGTRSHIVGRYDSNIAQAREMLATAEAELSSAVQSMTTAAPGVRDLVINNKQQAVDEAKSMIETFEQANN
jgi:spore coat protein CotF